MVRATPFEIVYDVRVKEHLREIERKHHPMIRHSIEQQLSYEPIVETRNRKLLVRGTDFEAEWELRFGPDNRFRVFYAVDSQRRQVQVLAIGVKRGSRLFIGGEEIEL